MSKLYLADRVSMDDIQEDANGRITGSFRVARAGNVQDYLGSELGLKDREIVRLYRPEEVVFARDSLAGFPHKLVTLGHPPGAADFEKHGVGWIGDEAIRDGEFVRIPMTVAHKRAVKQVKDGTRELSVGCVADVEFVAGTSPSGEPYDAKITSIDVDHVAIVDRARGGSNLRIGDWRTVDPSSNAQPTGGLSMATKTVLVDGISIETSEQGAQVIERLQRQLGDSATAATALKDGHARELGLKDAEIAKLQGEKDNLAAKVLTDAQLDARVAARADLVGKAKTLHDADYSGKSDAEIRRMVVSAKIGDHAVTGKADGYVEARFDGLLDSIAGSAGGADPFRRVVADGGLHKPSADNGQSAYEKRLADGWKNETAK